MASIPPPLSRSTFKEILRFRDITRTLYAKAWVTSAFFSFCLNAFEVLQFFDRLSPRWFSEYVDKTEYWHLKSCAINIERSIFKKEMCFLKNVWNFLNDKYSLIFWVEETVIKRWKEVNSHHYHSHSTDSLSFSVGNDYNYRITQGFLRAVHLS